MSSPTVNKIPTLVPSIDEVVTGMISADISKYAFLLVCHGDLFRNLLFTMFSEGGGAITTLLIYPLLFLFVFTVLNDGLKKNFSQVSVSVVDCPDLTQKPFMLAAPGITFLELYLCETVIDTDL